MNMRKGDLVFLKQLMKVVFHMLEFIWEIVSLFMPLLEERE